MKKENIPNEQKWLEIELMDEWRNQWMDWLIDRWMNERIIVNKQKKNTNKRIVIYNK